MFPSPRTKPSEPAESSNPRCEWSVCPHPHDAVRKPEWFRRKEDAEKWQDEVTIPASTWQHEKITRRDEGWHFLVPISWISDQESQPYRGRRFVDFMPVDQVGSAHVPDLNADIDEIFEFRHPEMSCDLGDDWKFESIRSDAQILEGHAYRGREVESLPRQLVKIACDLETSLNRHHPNLSAQAIAMFWTSWRVWQYLSVSCARVGNELGKLNPSAIIIPGNDESAAVAFVRRQAWFYGQEVMVSSATSTTLASTTTTGGTQEANVSQFVAETPKKQPLGSEQASIHSLTASKVIRRHGFRADLARHNAISAAVGKHFPGWKSGSSGWRDESKLQSICADLDLLHITVPDAWTRGVTPTLNGVALQGWSDALGLGFKKLVADQIRYSLKIVARGSLDRQAD